MSFLQLPRELRDMIYEDYFAVENGYIYDAELGKLTQADSSPISLSLSLVSRQVASEVRGVAFHVNTLTFSSFHSQRTQEAAAVLHATVGELTRLKRTMVRSLAYQLLTCDMVELATKAFPQFAPVFDGWMPQRDVPILYKKKFHCGQAPSIWDDFLHYILDLMSKHPLFLATASAIPRLSDLGADATQVNEASPKPWSIPEPAELERLASIIDVDATMSYYDPNTKYTYSAASIALRFLRTLPEILRSNLRTITLLEDRESIAYAKCHGRGFIGLCQSNPKLRVKRVVSLWQNAFPITPVMKLEYMLASQYPRSNYDLSGDRLLPKHIARALGAWMAETMALPSLGMPKGSYRLVFDGEPTLQHTSDVFKVVQRDIAWHCALDEAYSRGLLPTPSWLERRLRVGYLYEGLASTVDNLAKDDALVSCNFELGPSYDIEKLLEEHSTWTIQDWERNWGSHEQEGFDTTAPLPPWHMLRLHRVFD